MPFTPFPDDHPAARIRRSRRPLDHHDYLDVDPTLVVNAAADGRPPFEAVAHGIVDTALDGPVDAHGDTYDSLRARVLADIGATAAGWDDINDLLYCPDGHPVEDDGQCPDGHVSPLRAAGLI